MSMSTDGTVVAIGAYMNNGNGDYSGHVRSYMWDENAGLWQKRGQDIDGESAGDASGYSVSMSNNGTVIAIGATGNSGDGFNSGHVRVYEWYGKTNMWLKRGKNIDGEAANDLSGVSVSLSDDGIVVGIGSNYNVRKGVASGHVRIYMWDSTRLVWMKRGEDINGEAADDLSGSSVSFSNDGGIVAIGATDNDANGNGSGHVRVYTWDDTTKKWLKRGKDIDGEAAGDSSGRSVSLSNDGAVVAIGAYSNGGNGIESGHVRIYEWNETTSEWVKRGKDIDGEQAGDKLGVSVSMSNDGTVVAVGAHKNDGNGTSSGHVRVMKWDTNCHCINSPLKFMTMKNDRRIVRSCTWVARLSTKIRCALKGVSKTCPATCGTCPTCADSPLRIKFDYNGSYISRSCEWTTRKKNKFRCAIIGMSDTCRASCGSCP